MGTLSKCYSTFIIETQTQRLLGKLLKMRVDGFELSGYSYNGAAKNGSRNVLQFVNEFLCNELL